MTKLGRAGQGRAGQERKNGSLRHCSPESYTVLMTKLGRAGQERKNGSLRHCSRFTAIIYIYINIYIK